MMRLSISFLLATLLPTTLAFNDSVPFGYIETGPFGTISPGVTSLPANMATIRANAITAAQGVAAGTTDPNGLFNFKYNPNSKFFAQGTSYVAFGDSWTTDGSNGNGTVTPPLCSTGSAWKPSVGCSYEVLHGRACEGIEWPEYITNSRGLKRHDYAISGAYTDASFYNNSASDYMQTLYKSQNLNVDFATTTFTIFYGINDWFAGFPSVEFPFGHFPNSDFVRIGLPALLNHVKNTLVADGAKNLLFVGLPQWGPPLVANYPSILLEWQQTLGTDINLGFVSLWPLFIDTGADDQAKGPKYGFTQAWTGQCVEYGTIPDAEFFRQCDLNDLYSSFANAHPTTRMHSLMAAYITAAIDSCSTVPLGPAEDADGGTGSFNQIVWNPNPGPSAGANVEIFEQPATIVTQTIISTITIPVETVTQTITDVSTFTTTRTLDNLSTAVVFKTVSLAPSTVVISIPATITTVSIGPVILTVDKSGTPINSPVPTWITQVNAVTPTWTFNIEPPASATAVTFTAPLTGTATWVSIVTPPPHTSAAPPVVVTGPPGDHTRCKPTTNIWQLLWNIVIGGCLPLDVGIKGGVTPLPIKPPGWTGPWTPPVVYPTAPPNGGDENQPTGTQTQSSTSSSSSTSSTPTCSATSVVYDLPDDPENVDFVADGTDPETRKRSTIGIAQDTLVPRINVTETLLKRATPRHIQVSRCPGLTITSPSSVDLGAGIYYTVDLPGNLNTGVTSITLHPLQVSGRPGTAGSVNQEHVYELRYFNDMFTDTSTALSTLSCTEITNIIVNAQSLAGPSIANIILLAIDNTNNMVWVDKPLNQAKSNVVNQNRGTAANPPQKASVDKIADYRTNTGLTDAFKYEIFIRNFGALGAYFGATAGNFRNTAQQVQDVLLQVTPSVPPDASNSIAQLYHDWLEGVINGYPNGCTSRATNCLNYYQTHIPLQVTLPPTCLAMYYTLNFNPSTFNAANLLPPAPNHAHCNVPGTRGTINAWAINDTTGAIISPVAPLVGVAQQRIIGSGDNTFHFIGSGANLLGSRFQAEDGSTLFGITTAATQACQGVLIVADTAVQPPGGPFEDIFVSMFCGASTGNVKPAPMGFVRRSTRGVLECITVTFQNAGGASQVVLCAATTAQAVRCGNFAQGSGQATTLGHVQFGFF